MKSKFLVSIVLPVYNAERFIFKAIESILTQTYSNIELIVINDGSTDNSLEEIKKFNDSRLIVIDRENKGLIYTLNEGFNLSRGKYIARMDADDISNPTRLEKQVNFLENNIDYVVCSSSRIIISENDKRIGVEKMPSSDIDIRTTSIFNSPFTHPCILIKRASLKGLDRLYDDNFKYAEDYELWCRLLKVGKGYNFREALLYYRDVKDSQTKVGESISNEREKIIKKIQKIALSSYNIKVTEKESDLLYNLSLSSMVKDLNFKQFSIGFIISFFSKIHNEFKYENENASNDILGRIYIKILIFNINRISFVDLLKLFFNKFTYFGVKNLFKEHVKIN